MPQDNKRTDEIERTIEETRADLDETLDELEARFSPEYFADQVIDYVRGPGAGRIAQAIRDNPVAAVLAAVGIGWLLLGARRRSVSDPAYRDLGHDPSRPPLPSHHSLVAGGSAYGQSGGGSYGQAGRSAYGQGSGSSAGGAAAYPSTTRYAGQGGSTSGLGAGSSTLGGSTPGASSAGAGSTAGTSSGSAGASTGSSTYGTGRPAVRGDSQGSTGGI